MSVGFRLFMMPGVFHCGGGPGAGSFDSLAAMMQWMEQGIAPERIVASRFEDGKKIRGGCCVRILSQRSTKDRQYG
jgi:feruloyl esterase